MELPNQYTYGSNKNSLHRVGSQQQQSWQQQPVTNQPQNYQQEPLPYTVPPPLQPPQPPAFTLPPGWITATDPVSGRMYYANASTGQTSWDPPSLPPPPPPPVQLISPPASVPNPDMIQKILQPRILTTQSSINTSGLVVPIARACISKAITSQNSKENAVEFERLSAGTISDLARIQLNYREEQAQAFDEEEGSCDDERKRYFYEPLKPFELPITSKAPHIEPGRVEMRLFSLLDALGKL